jgi:hypothetical protein
MTISIPIISEFDGGGISKAKAEFSQLEGAGKKAGFAMKKAFLPATAAVGALAVGLFDATKGAIEDAAAQDLLANTLNKATGATDAQIAANEDWISTHGKLLGVTDDELRPVLGKLARATGSVTDAQKLATQAMDIAAATGKPLATVTTALEKAYGGNLTALAKLAPEYRQMIKDGASFDEVMAAMAVTTGGAATEAANTAEKQFKRLGVALNETKESIGAALMPVIEAALPLLMAFGTWAQNNTSILIGVGIAIASIAVAIMAVNVAMAILASPIILIVAGIVAVGAAIGIAYKKFEGFRNVVDDVFGAIRWWINNVTIPAVEALVAVFKFAFNNIARLWNNTIGRLSFDIPNWVPGVGGKGFSVPNIPMLAQGGIVTGPTLAMIGEGNGPEAVIPLNRMGEFGMGGGSNVTINVNGGDPNAVVDALRRYMRQNGSVPITVSTP